MKTVTLANLAESTEQEVFDTVARGLAAQGFERAEDGCSCVYRNGSGLKCAAGQLMTDEEYAALDGVERCLSWSDLVTMKAVPAKHHAFIGRLQSAHDASERPVDMYLALKACAMQLELNTDALDEEPCGV